MGTPADNIKRIPILGVPVSQVTYASILQLMTDWIHGPTTRTVVAANVHVITEAAINEEFRRAILDADVITPDGMPLIWASRLLGGSIKNRCYGPFIMQHALDHFGEDTSHYLYGSTEQTLDKMKQSISERWPNAQIVGAMSPPFGPFDDEVELRNIQAINASGADIVWVGMGCPKQELWMHRYREHLSPKVVLAVGAAFDFIARTVPQAPPWMQQHGLEWVFRLLMEPRRLWARYLIRNPYFIWQFTLQLLGLRWQSTSEPPQSRTD